MTIADVSVATTATPATVQLYGLSLQLWLLCGYSDATATADPAGTVAAEPETTHVI